jgi:hypothetical protein
MILKLERAMRSAFVLFILKILSVKIWMFSRVTPTNIIYIKHTPRHPHKPEFWSYLIKPTQTPYTISMLIPLGEMDGIKVFVSSVEHYDHIGSISELVKSYILRFGISRDGVLKLSGFSLHPH